MAAGVDLAHLDTGEPLGDTSRFVSANAYLGCWGIVEALRPRRRHRRHRPHHRRRRRVRPGGVAPRLGAATTGTRWPARVVAGHVIECGTQATGGNYSFFTEVPGMARTGFPWAEVAADGSSVIGKHDGTGGEVSIGTVTSQLLYEIGGPAYLGPDVTARFDTIELEQVGPDRVRIRGARGEPPPPTLKVAMNELGGYRNDLGVALTGLDIEAKAAARRGRVLGGVPVRARRLRQRHHPAGPHRQGRPGHQRGGRRRLAAHGQGPRRAQGRAGPSSNAMVELGLATIPGFFGVGGGPGAGRPYGVYRPAVVPADLVPQHVVVLGGDRTVVDSVAPPAGAVDGRRPRPGPTAAAPGGATVRAPLGRVVGARSGDKGGNANLGVFARTDEAWAWLDGVPHRRAAAGAAAGDGRRSTSTATGFPTLRSLNFVIHGLLQEGVAASTRQDGQAKSLGEWLRARVVDVPRRALPRPNVRGA